MGAPNRVQLLRHEAVAMMVDALSLRLQMARGKLEQVAQILACDRANASRSTKLQGVEPRRHAFIEIDDQTLSRPISHVANSALFVECRSCGHARSAFLIFRHAGLLQRPERPTPSEVQAIAHRLKCSACGARDFECVEVPDKDTQPYWATSASPDRIFHRPSCRWMQGVSADSEIHFTHRQAAVGRGYAPCQSCKP